MKALGENGWKVLTGKALTLRYPLIRRDISVPVDPKKRSLLQVSIPPAGLYIRSGVLPLLKGLSR